VARVVVERRDAWHRLVLNAPERLNAFTAAMHAELAAAIDAAEADPACRVLVLTGAGRAFCAGQDLNERVTPPGQRPDLGDTLERLYNPLIRRLRALPLPVIAAVNGVAAGAGANLALAADIVLAARSASFVQAFARLALVPDSGGTWFLPRLVGDARARALCLTTDPVDAETAAAWGMIWRAVPDDTLEAETVDLASRLAQSPRGALGRIKRALNASAGNTLAEQLDLERDLQREAGESDAYMQAVQAFLSKKK
jgi:2-(1,2-epoxy-1,2-dihydrophenyl)acetyl-CoA isomerase